MMVGSKSARPIDATRLTVARLAEIVSETQRYGECWLYTRVHHSGYSYVRVGHTRPGVHRVVHAVCTGIYEQNGRVVDHLCKRKNCINPKHLELVEQTVNIARGTALDRAAEFNRRKTHCPVGHEYSSENTVWWNGWRKCRTCDRNRRRESYRRKN
jgi:hypothetical protein